MREGIYAVYSKDILEGAGRSYKLRIDIAITATYSRSGGADVQVAERLSSAGQEIRPNRRVWIRLAVSSTSRRMSGTEGSQEFELQFRACRDMASSMPDVLVIPVGALEQHGPHLPIGTDTLHAKAVALGAASLADSINVLVAPPVAYGCSDHHLPFGSTLSMSTSTLLAVLRDLVRSSAASGFGRVFFLNGHGGNHEIVQLAARDGSQEFGIPVGAGSWWLIAWDALVEAGATNGVRLPGHAGGFETAVISALMQRDFDDLPSPSAEFSPSDPRRFEEPFRVETPEAWAGTEGYSDDPGALDRELGQIFLDTAAFSVACSLVEFVDRSPLND